MINCSKTWKTCPNYLKTNETKTKDRMNKLCSVEGLSFLSHNLFTEDNNNKSKSKIKTKTGTFQKANIRRLTSHSQRIIWWSCSVKWLDWKKCKNNIKVNSRLWLSKRKESWTRSTLQFPHVILQSSFLYFPKTDTIFDFIDYSFHSSYHSFDFVKH